MDFEAQAAPRRICKEEEASQCYKLHTKAGQDSLHFRPSETRVCKTPGLACATE